MAESPNYHIQLWPEPPGPSTYLCLLCTVKDQTQADIRTHVTTVHAVAPMPTPLAADDLIAPTLRHKDAPHANEPDVPDGEKETAPTDQLQDSGGRKDSLWQTKVRQPTM